MFLARAHVRLWGLTKVLREYSRLPMAHNLAWCVSTWRDRAGSRFVLLDLLWREQEVPPISVYSGSFLSSF